MSVHLLSTSMSAWLGLLAALIGFRIMNGQIGTRDLLSVRPSGPVSPERVQLLLVWLIGVGGYALMALESPSPTLPEVPESLLFAMAGSQSIYAGGKILRRVIASKS